MSEEILLRPEELFFLGTIMQAQYLDYDYIAAMDGIGKDYERVRKQAIRSLARARLIRERLSGEISLRSQTEKLMKNVFFGKLETILELRSLEVGTQTIRIHHGQDCATIVTQVGSGFALRLAASGEIEALAKSAVGSHSAQSAGPCDLSAATKIITAKQARVGSGSASWVFLECGGNLCTADGSPITDSHAADIITRILKGE